MMRSDRWLGPFIALFALAWLALVYNYIPTVANVDEPGPRGFPIVLGIALAGFGLLITFSAYRGGAKPAATAEKPLTRREATIVGATFGLLVLYAFLMERIGFTISTMAVILLIMFGILRMRNWGFMLLLSAGITFICWLFFAFFLGAPLPQGSWLRLLS